MQNNVLLYGNHIYTLTDKPSKMVF